MKKLSSILLAFLFLVGCSNSPKVEEAKTTTMEEPSQTSEVYSVNVVVVGAGGAGMAAALSAKENGTEVVVIEQMDYVGGNTSRAEGGMNAAGTVFQKEKGIEDTAEAMIEDTIKGGKELNDKELVTFLAENSSPTVDWLTSIGMDLSDIGQGAGATNARMHRSSDGAKVGSVLIPVLTENLEKNDITVLKGTKATKIITDEDGKVAGIEAVSNDKTITINSNAVVLATGGFGANEELFVKYREDLAGFTTTNHPGATGSGIILAQEVGADTVDMDKIQTNPTVEVTTQTVISETVRGKGAIFVNQSGERFTSEMQTRDVLSAEILKQNEKYAYLIFDQRVMDSMKALQTNYEKGIITKGQTLEELASALEIDEKTFKASMEKWNSFVANQKDEDFGRDKGMDEDLSKAPFYAIKVSPAVHYTMGGVKINTNTEVINTEGKVIPGLFAAGEVTGGVHGGNRLGGNAVADIMVYGRQAGIKVSEYVKTLTSIETVLPTKEKTEAPSEKGSLKDGTYEGVGKGNEEGLKVSVTVENGNITDIAILESKETPSIFDGAKDVIVSEIIKTQSTEVDIVTGATNSSNGLIEAVNNAIEGAK